MTNSTLFGEDSPNGDDSRNERAKLEAMYKDLIQQNDAKYQKTLDGLRKDNNRLVTEVKNLKEFEKEKARYKPDKTYGLNVSGDVMLNKMEVAIVDTPSFQRMAYINQLGSTNTVYRSANHTRFEHSLGVLKMADRMVQQIRSNKHSSLEESHITMEEEQIIRLLALLHDIGHMPFGHTIEDEFNIFESHDKHESRWQYFLGPNSEIGRIIITHAGTDEDGLFDERKGIEFHARFFKLIKCEKNFSGIEDDAYMYDIVSNTVCADLLDYLQRDCQYTNLKLDYHPRFLNYLVIKRLTDPEGTAPPQRRIVIRLCKIRNAPRKDIYSELVQLLRNRYYLGERVYYHHTKIKTGTLIAGAVLRAKEAGFFKFLEGYDAGKIYAPGDGPLYDLHIWNDMNLLTRLSDIKANDSTQPGRYLLGARNLANAYLNREVYTQLDSEDQTKLGLNPVTMQEVIDKKIDMTENRILEVKLKNNFGNPKSRLAAEDYLVDLLPDVRSGDFLIYFPSYKMQMKLADVKIEEDDGQVRRLRKSKDKIIERECEEIINKHKSLWMMRAFVHPRFTNEKHPLYNKEFYPMYQRIMKKYCKWIFARNEAESRDFGEDFWKELISFKIDTQLDGTTEETMRIYNPIRNAASGKKQRQELISNIADTCLKDTSKKRSNDELIDMIKTTFLTNDKL